MQVAKKMSFELNPEMLELLNKEFDPVKLAEKFAGALADKKGKEIEDTGEKLFADYGRDWIRKTLQLGEEYPDRTYEVIRAAIDKTNGHYKFGLVPQRFLEIAYLSIQQFATLPILECYARKLVYRVPDCYTYRCVKEKVGDSVAEMMLCRHACLSAIDTLHDDLGIDALVQMEATNPKAGYCQFAIVPA